MSSQSVVLLIMGVSGSGKSLIGTILSQKLAFEFADADQYHTVANKAKMSQGIALTDADRAVWLGTLAEVVNQWVENGKNGVIACSALKDSYRRTILGKAEHSLTFYLKGDYGLISQRLGLRQHEFMNPTLLHSQFEILEEPQNALCLDINQSPEQIVNRIILRVSQEKNFAGPS